MDKQIDKMSPGELVEEFRNYSQKLGEIRLSGNSDELTRISRRADLLEQEIVKRIAW